MIPIELLKAEHRLMNRMVSLMQHQYDAIVATRAANVDFIERLADFMRTYADRCHNGKETLLFDALTGKDLDEKLVTTMQELNREHAEWRGFVDQLVRFARKYAEGDTAALDKVTECMKSLIDFLPKHTAKEDDEFFDEVGRHFSDDERAELLAAFNEHDRRLIHACYSEVVKDWECREADQ